MGIDALTGSAPLLAAGVLLDALFGDPQYAFHPIRLIGRTLTALEKLLFRWVGNGYAAGCLLFLLLALIWVAAPSVMIVLIAVWNPLAAAVAHVLAIYLLLAFRDLIDHVRAVQRAADSADLARARAAAGLLVGRDTDTMDIAACRRAAIESLGENFVDGFLSAVFWYVVAGLPGLLLFKVVSTMDSMVGYKTPKYLRFGWCGARLDDLMNYVPARMGWLILGLSALPFPALSAANAWRIGLEQHAIVPGPNPGWSEAAMAGLLRRRLIGPIWKDGSLVTDVWLGAPEDPPAGSEEDLRRAMRTTVLAAFIVTAAGMAALAAF